MIVYNDIESPRNCIMMVSHISSYCLQIISGAFSIHYLYLGMHTAHFSACLHRNYSNLARKVYKKPTKRHYRDNIEYRDILTHVSATHVTLNESDASESIT